MIISQSNIEADIRYKTPVLPRFITSVPRCVEGVSSRENSTTLIALCLYIFPGLSTTDLSTYI